VACRDHSALIDFARNQIQVLNPHASLPRAQVLSWDASVATVSTLSTDSMVCWMAPSSGPTASAGFGRAVVKAQIAKHVGGSDSGAKAAS
jgi:hypothetical protein